MVILTPGSGDKSPCGHVRQRRLGLIRACHEKSMREAMGEVLAEREREKEYGQWGQSPCGPFS